MRSKKLQAKYGVAPDDLETGDDLFSDVLCTEEAKKTANHPADESDDIRHEDGLVFSKEDRKRC